MIIVQFEHWEGKMWYFLSPDREKVFGFPFFLISIGLHELQPKMVKKNGHPNDQFFYHTKGVGILSIYDKTYQLKPGMGFFIPKNVPHSYYPITDEWDIRWFVPGGNALPQLYENLNIKKGAIYQLADTAPLDIIINKMREELIHDLEYGNCYASSHVYEFIIEFSRQANLLSSGHIATEGLGNKPYSKHMKKLTEYISYHFPEKLTMEHLCDLIHVSPQHLCRIVKSNTGMRPMEYINEIRIQNAKELLKNTNENIQQIAFACGYDNYNYFYRTFKATTKMTPMIYRNRTLL